MRKPAFLIAIGAGLLLVGCTTTTQTATPGAAAPATTSAVPEVPAGKPLTVSETNSDGQAVVTILTARVAKTGKGQYSSAPANGAYVIADVDIQGRKATYPSNPLYFRYAAPNGRTFGPLDGNAIMAGYEPRLPSGDVPAGQRSRGYVVFDVPVGKGAKIQLTDPLGSIVGVWILP